MEDRISKLLHYHYVGILQGRWAFRLDVDKEYHCSDVFSRWVDLAYDIIPQCQRTLSIASNIVSQLRIE